MLFTWRSLSMMESILCTLARVCTKLNQSNLLRIIYTDDEVIENLFI